MKCDFVSKKPWKICWKALTSNTNFQEHGKIQQQCTKSITSLHTRGELARKQIREENGIDGSFQEAKHPEIIPRRGKHLR